MEILGDFYIENMVGGCLSLDELHVSLIVDLRMFGINSIDYHLEGKVR